MSWYLEKKQVYLMKESKYFNYKEKRHITYDYFEKKKIIVIVKGVSKDNNSQKKEKLFLKPRKRAYLFL